MTRYCVISLVSLLVAAAPVAAQPASVMVGEPATIGVDPGSAATFGQLVRGALAAEGFAVVSRERTPDTPCGDAACAAGLLRGSTAATVLVSSLSRLGNKIIVGVVRVGADGRVQARDQITAASVEDLEPIAKRIAHSVRTGTPLSDNATTTTVTQNETAPQKRKKAMFTSGLRLGMMVPMRDSYGEASALTAWTLFGMFEFPAFAFTAELGILSTADADDEVGAFGLHLDLGAFKFFDPEADTGTYVGGGIGFRATSVSRSPYGDDSASGIGVFVNAGVVLLRTSDFHLIADVRYDANLFRMRDLMTKTTSHGVIVSLGFSYTKLSRLFGR